MIGSRAVVKGVLWGEKSPEAVARAIKETQDGAAGLCEGGGEEKGGRGSTK